MLGIVFFIWIGIALEMPPVWFVLCGVYIFAWAVSSFAKIVKFIKDE